MDRGVVVVELEGVIIKQEEFDLVNGSLDNSFKDESSSEVKTDSRCATLDEASDTGRTGSFVCGDCGYRTTKSSNLKRHRMRHTGERPFACDVCDMRTSQLSALQSHKRTHTGDKPYECDECNFRARRSSQLRDHARSHRGDRPYMCDQCDYKAVRSGELNRHKRRHAGDRPFVCLLCDYRASRPAHLATHMMSHTGDKPFGCDECDYRAINSTKLKAHKRRRHDSLTCPILDNGVILKMEPPECGNNDMDTPTEDINGQTKLPTLGDV